MVRSIHELTVARLSDVYPQSSRRGFASAVRAALEDSEFRTPIIPDLFWVEPGAGRECDRGTIVCIEVEDSNPIDVDKLSLYGELWEFLDSAGCELRLIVTDRWGNDAAEIKLQSYVWRRRDMAA